MRVLVVLFVVLLSACSGNQLVNNPLSSDEIAHELLILSSSYISDDEITAGLTSQQSGLSKDGLELFQASFKSERINQALKEYVMANMPEDKAREAIAFYRTETGSKYIASMERAEALVNEAGNAAAQRVAVLKKDKKLLAHKEALVELIDIDSLMQSILFNGVVKPLVQALILNKPGSDSVSLDQMDEVAEASLDKVVGEISQIIDNIILITLADLSVSERKDVISYAQSEAGNYDNKVIAGAYEFAFSQASYKFGTMLAGKLGKTVVPNGFDFEECKKKEFEFTCEVKSIGSAANSIDPLYLGSAVMGGSKQYRAMMTDTGWQQLNLSNGFDDMIISKKDGKALISVNYESNRDVNVEDYADKLLGDISKAIDSQYSRVNLKTWQFDPNASLYEICYSTHDEQNVCKLAGGAQMGDDAFYLHAVFEPSDDVTREVVNILSTFEPVSLAQ